MSEEHKSQQTDDQVEDLEVEQSDAEEVKGGVRMAGGKQQDYLKVTLEDVQISSYD
jgi:type VI protein secretion system component Hcp